MSHREPRSGAPLAADGWEAIDPRDAAVQARIAELEARIAGLERERDALRSRLDAVQPAPAPIARSADGALHADEPILTHASCAGAGVWDIDLVGDNSDWSDSYCELFGLPRDVRPSRECCIASVHPDDRARVEEACEGAWSGDGFKQIEFRILRNGEVRWLHSEGRAVFIDGRPVRASGIVWDITEHKRALDALRASELRYRSLVNAASAVTWRCPPSGIQVEPQPAWMHFTGQTAEEMLGTGWTRALHPDDVAAVTRRWQEAVASGEPIRAEYRIRRHDGQWRWTSVHAVPMRYAEGRMIEWFGMNLDVTDRKEAEQAALAAERLARQRLAELEDLYRNAPVGLCLLDRELRYLRINERLAEINGIPAAAHLGKTMHELLPERLVSSAEPTLRAVLETGRPCYHQQAFGETLSQPGVERSWEHHALPVRDADGEITGISIVVEETTERRRADLALRDAAQRKDAFLAALAHELRNPLAPLRTGLEIIVEQGRGLDWAEHTGAMMQRQLAQLVRLVDDLLDLSRIDRGRIQLRRERVALADVLQQAGETVRPLIDRRGHRLTVDAAGGDLTLDADPVRLAQVFVNLLGNAAKYTEPGGDIAVRVTRSGPNCVVRVEDNGMGIAPALLPRVFELFVSGQADTDASSLGIGLHLVRRLVEMHGGRVEAQSDGPGRGSSFIVQLPMAVGDDAVGQPSAGRAGGARSGRRVLVVDDNRDAADSLGLMLRIRGHDTRIVYDGFAALRLMAEFHPEVVLLDIGMPEMDGCETARHMRASTLGRDLLLVAVTGWSQDEVRARTRAAGFDRHLVKPVAAATLNEVLAAAGWG